MLRYESGFLGIVESFELEVARVPARTRLSALDDKECRGADDRNQVEGEQHDVFHQVLGRKPAFKWSEHQLIVKGWHIWTHF